MASRPANFEQRMRVLVDEHFDFVWRSVRRLGVREADTDDAAQRVFLVAADKLESIEPGAERSFLFGTAMRVASHVRRRYRSDREVGDDSLATCGDCLPSPEELTDQRRMRELTDKILSEMSIDLRAVLVLFEVEELTTPEIAELLQIPLGTAASRLRRAREEFRERVSQVLGGHVPDGSRT